MSDLARDMAGETEQSGKQHDGLDGETTAMASGVAGELTKSRRLRT
jgi:hypothetical protein